MQETLNLLSKADIKPALIIEDLLRRTYGNINCKDLENLTLLHHALNLKRLDVVEELIKIPAVLEILNLNFVDWLIKNPLNPSEEFINNIIKQFKSGLAKLFAINAAIQGDLVALDQLCKLLTESEKQFLLLAIAKAGQVNSLQCLLEKKHISSVQINSRGVDGLTPLLCAAMGNQLIFIKMLISNAWISKEDVCEQCDAKGHTVFLWAVKRGYLDILNWLLAEYPGYIESFKLQTDNYIYGNALVHAGMHGHKPVLDWLFKTEFADRLDFKEIKTLYELSVHYFWLGAAPLEFLKNLLQQKLIFLADFKEARNYVIAPKILMVAARYGNSQNLQWCLDNEILTTEIIQNVSNMKQMLMLAVDMDKVLFIQWLFDKHLKVQNFNRIEIIKTLADILSRGEGRLSIKSFVKQQVFKILNEKFSSYPEEMDAIKICHEHFLMTDEEMLLSKIRCHLRFGKIEQAHKTCMQIFNEIKTCSKKTKNEVRSLIANMIFMNQFEIPDNRNILFMNEENEEPVVIEGELKKLTLAEEKRLTNAAIMAYQFVVDNETFLANDLREKFDEILSGNFSLKNSNAKKIWLSNSLSLFNRYYAGYHLISPQQDPRSITEVIALRAMELIEEQRALVEEQYALVEEQHVLVEEQHVPDELWHLIEEQPVSEPAVDSRKPFTTVSTNFQFSSR